MEHDLPLDSSLDGITSVSLFSSFPSWMAFQYVNPIVPYSTLTLFYSHMHQSWPRGFLSLPLTVLKEASGPSFAPRVNYVGASAALSTCRMVSSESSYPSLVYSRIYEYLLSLFGYVDFHLYLRGGGRKGGKERRGDEWEGVVWGEREKR